MATGVPQKSTWGMKSPVFDFLTSYSSFRSVAPLTHFLHQNFFFSGNWSGLKFWDFHFGSCSECRETEISGGPIDRQFVDGTSAIK